jgi:hypothetical protein
VVGFWSAVRSATHDAALSIAVIFVADHVVVRRSGHHADSVLRPPE